MRKNILFLVLICLSLSMKAQLRIAVGYNYNFAGGWDRAIQTYNFARPELTNKQPLLIHGIDLSFDYLRKSEKSIKHGFMVSYRYFRSAVTNENFDVAINAHLINIGYGVSSRNTVNPGKFFFDVSVSALCGGIFRRVNGEALVDDESKVWAPGIGGELRPRIGYDVIMKEKMVISPYIQTTYCPFYFSPRSEALLNQTITLTGPKYTGILSLEAGICISLTSREPNDQP